MEGFRGNLLVTLNESLLYRSHELQFTYYKVEVFQHVWYMVFETYMYTLDSAITLPKNN